MSNYVKATNFATKDTLPTGDSNKIVKGTELDNEFNSIAGAVSSKADIASPTFTGTPAAPTATSGSNTTQIANTAYVKVAVETGDALKADKTLTITAGTGLSGGGDLSANRTVAIANSGVTAATYGSTTKIPVIAINAQGQVTSASEATLVPFAWDVTYLSTSIGEGSSYTIPSNCIQVNGYVTTTFGGMTGGLARLTIKNGATTLGSTLAGLTSGNDGGGGFVGYFPVSVSVPSSATSIAVSRESGGNSVAFVVTSYVTKA
jgi:hypothetical protein